MSVLVISEHRDGAMRGVSCELVTAATSLGGSVVVAVIGSNAPSLADSVNVEGVDEVVTVSCDSAEFDADVWRAAVAALIEQRSPDVVLAGHTVDSMSFAPAVAARRGMGFASDVIDVRRDGSALVVVRSFYGGKVNGELEFADGTPVLLMLRAATWPEADGAGSAPVASLPAPAVASRTRHQGFTQPPAGDVDITTSDLILAIGRGVGEKTSIAQFEELAGAMGATLACSRPLVDAGWMPASRQVGQSGTTVTPQVYLALGISGAVQHLAGMKNAGTILAVNTDPEAAIFSVAHYGSTCDMFDLADELEQAWD
jgi:electron transfer flavoprotein alpha subunit